MDPYLQRHPYTNIGSGLPSSPYLPYDFFPTLYLHFNASRSGGALPPTSPLYQHRFRIPLLALPTLRFFPILYLHFNSSRSGGALSPTSPLQQHRIRIPLLALPTLRFFPDSTSILTILEAVEPYLQRHPYTNIGSGFPSSPYLPYDFFPTLYLHFNSSRSGGALPPTPPLQQHPTGLLSSPYRPYDFFPTLYLHFNFFTKRWSHTSNVTPTPYPTSMPSIS